MSDIFNFLAIENHTFVSLNLKSNILLKRMKMFKINQKRKKNAFLNFQTFYLILF